MPENPLLDPPRASDRAATTDEPLAVGDRAGGVGIPAGVPNLTARYLLGDEIARGGMGVVYRATDTVLGREVAVKVLPEKYAPDSGTARRFADEARITGQLQHPNIPAVHDLGVLPDGQPFLAMKLIKGETLENLLKDRADPADGRGQFVAAFEQVCQAVGYAHVHDVIHRDLKPANVMVGAFGEVQVMDWGLAKVLGARSGQQADPEATTAPTAVVSLRDSDDLFTQTGSVLGTPAFMSPEQAAGAVGVIDTRSDVFGLGAVLAVVLTGRPPFVADTSESTRVKAAQGDVGECFARLDACGADPDLVALCQRCLAPRPEDRPSDAGAVAKAVAALRAAADERARRAELERVRVEGEQATAAARSAERRKRRRLALGAAAVLALAAVGGLVAVLAVQRRANADLADKNYELANETRAAEEAAAEARRRGDAERWQRYRSNLAAAGSALQLQSSAAARRALEAAPAEYRDWEWLHFTSRLDEARLVLFGGVLALREYTTVAFRPDGKQVATGQNDGTVRVWDAATGREVGLLPGQGQGIRELAFSPDGRRLLVFTWDGTLQSWDPAVNDRQVLRRIPFREISGAILSRDQRLLFGIKDDAGQVWDVSTGRKRADLPGRLRGPGESAAAFSPDGRRLAYSTDDLAIHVWDLETGAEAYVLRGHTSPVEALAFSPDGKRLASGSRHAENSARLWDVATGKEIDVLRGHRNEVISVAFSPDGTRLATASLDQTARLWDGVTGRDIATLLGHRGQVRHVAFRPDGRRLVTSSLDGTLRLWDAATGSSVAVLHGHAAGVWRSVFSPDGALLASASEDSTTRLWDTALAERSGVLRGHTSDVYDVAFSPDGTRAASAAWDGTVRLWDPTRCRPTGPPLSLPAGVPPMVIGVSFRPDGKQLAAASGDDYLRVWDAASGKLLRKLRCPSGDWRQYARAAFDPKGTALAAGGKDGLIRLWDTDGDEPMAPLAGHEDTVADVAFRPDGKQLASCGLDKTVRLWDVATRNTGAVLRGHTDTVHRVAYSADGRLLASASVDRTVRLWDPATGEALAVLPHGSIVYGVAFNPSGTRLAAGCADNTIRLWDVWVARRAGGKEAPDAEVAELRGHDAYVHAVDWSPDGTRLTSASGDFTVRIWDSLSAQERTKPTRGNEN